MKTFSNLPLPVTPMRWKDGEYIMMTGHKDNGAQPAEKEGSRYEAEFTIVKDLTAEAAINAFTRGKQDVELEKQVVDNIEVDGGNAIDVVKIYAVKVQSTIFPALPSSGNLKRGQIFSYNNGAVMVVQDHARTAFAPELTPALFSFYRENTEGKEWIAGEQITVNATRTYNGKTYKCLQAHQSQASWSPELTLGTLWQIVVTSSAWTIGVAYKVNDIVTYLGKSYKCRQAHTSISTWTPTAATSLWLLI